jgi:hypothetical protein
MQPEEEMAMAAGGLTSLPMREMNFGSGGIIAFANPEGNQLVKDEAARELKEAQDRLNSFANKSYKNLTERQQDTAAIEAAKADVARAESKIAGLDSAGMDTSPVGAMGKRITAPVAPPVSRPTEVMTPQQMEAAKVKPVAPPPAANQNIPGGGIVNVIPPKPPAAPPAPPAAPVPSTAQKFQEGILAGTGLPEIPKEWTPPKQAPIGEDYLKYMGDREQKRREDAMKFENVEKDRARRDLWNSLSAAGEATRGQKGIGALFTGAGRSLGESLTAAEERESAFRQKQQDLADNDAKTRFEIANLRRAEERGDSKAIYESKVKLVELSNQRAQMQSTTANEIARRESEKELALLRFEYEKKLKGIPQAQRETLEEQYVRAAVKAGKPLTDAIREVKTLGVEAKGQLTYSQASDDIDKWLASTQGMSYIAEARKAAKDQGKPIPDQFTIRNQLIKKAMEDSGGSRAPKANSDLLKAADAIVGAK